MVFPLTLAAFLLATVVVLVTLNRQQVEEVTVGPAKFHFSTTEIEQNQPAIEQKVAELDSQARSQSHEAPVPNVNLTGDWVGAGGAFTWRLRQYGNQIVLQELTPPYGVTGVGQGVVVGNDIAVDYTSIDWAPGRIALTITGDNGLAGTIVIPAHGVNTTVRVNR